MAKIYNVAATSDNVVILNTREGAVQPFSAPGWTDLRVGMILSLTQPGNDNMPTGLDEYFNQSPVFNPANWMWLGIKDPSPNMPGATGTQFIGFSNVVLPGAPLVQLFRSDLGYGTGTYYWRPSTSTGQQTFLVTTNLTTLATGPNTIQCHFFQSADPGNPAPSGYYCGMLGFRLTRPTPTSNQVTILVPQAGANSSDMYWTNAPTQANLLAKLDPWPGTVVTIGPVTLPVLPSALFVYWPYTLSRIRISAWGVLRAA